MGGGVIQKDSEFKASLSISNFISVTVMKYPGQSNNNNNNNNLVGKRICFSSQAQVTAQWCREGKVARTQATSHSESRAARNECLHPGSLACAQVDFLTLMKSETLCLGNGAAYNGLCLPT